MKEKGKWPIDDVEQDTVLIYGLTHMLERVLGTVPEETHISHWQSCIVDEEGGSTEIDLLVDYLHSEQMKTLLDLENDEMKDGQPRIHVMVHNLYDEEWQKHLLEKWKVDKEDYPNSKFIEHFVINIQIEYTKNDWGQLMAEAAAIKNDLKLCFILEEHGERVK